MTKDKCKYCGSVINVYELQVSVGKSRLHLRCMKPYEELYGG